MSLPTTTPTKKRKQHEEFGNTRGSSSKRSKTERKEKRRDKKGKARASAPAGEFKVVKASLRVSVPPVFGLNPMSGVEEMLDSLVMRYIPALHGVLLCHSNVRFLSKNAIIKGDCPFANCDVAFDATVWSPQVGMVLTGRINLCSPDHISLLIHRTFNISIPRHHIPTDNWEFEYGPAENDPEFGHDASKTLDVEEDPIAEFADGTESPDGLPDGVEAGKWVHKVTGDRLGGPGGTLDFTVISLTIANQMLSLVGSIQQDPFSTEHVAQPAILSTAASKKAPSPHVNASDSPDADPIDDILDSDEDAFGALGRLGDEAAARENARALKEAEEAKAEKKKRKKEKKERSGEADGEAKPKKKKAKQRVPAD